MDKKVIGIGELLYDIFPTGKKLGGAPVNFAYHVQQSGIESLAISAVGMDDLGNEILAELKQKNIDNIVPQLDKPTGTVKVTLDDRGVPDFEICENVAWDNIPYSPFFDELSKNCAAICFGTLSQRSEVSRNTINALIDACPSDTMVVYDINLRQSFYSKELIERSMLKADVLKINDDELNVVASLFEFDSTDQIKGCRYLLNKYGLDMVILTCGENGSYVVTDAVESYCPTPRVDVVDTVGAGDSFTAAFVSSLLRGEDIKAAHKRAVDVAAYVCTQSGAMPELPTDLK